MKPNPLFDPVVNWINFLQKTDLSPESPIYTKTQKKLVTQKFAQEENNIIYQRIIGLIYHKSSEN